ncbi:uncharacterized protein LOC142320658 isoform X2 [Lycorma delicatula]|uniref:uncharacterized protein LOC142320658 isoform X2 n=1 Tax=Lycorma delicatula TaxID=130591 RepID=UPI003F513F68
MEEEKKKELKVLEYENQFFGCSSKDVIDGTNNFMRLSIKSCVKGLVDALKENCKNIEKDSVYEIGQAIADSYLKASKIPLKNLEEVIKECYQIPSYVLLPEDEPQKHQYSAADMVAIDNEVTSLLKRAEKAKLMEAAVKMELNNTEDFLEKLQLELSSLENTIKMNDYDKSRLHKYKIDQ